MVDKEKVINGLECCATNRLRLEDCEAMDCAYLDLEGHGCIHQLIRDALALLKAQEAQEVTKPIWIDGGVKTIGHFECGKCGANMGTNPKSCWCCGRKVKWE